ncbi:hypothetical protein [Acetobacter malorum]|uniref:hypothetical protein n=1 Tax=Acetobacter malorum TaxID=178901 RepID=UPI0009EF5CF4|nr:hypothetical protein [Acetobacter malorum]
MSIDQKIQDRIAESLKLGTVSSSEWQAYTWKNELTEQRRRIVLHLDEALMGSETEHHPLHMLERSIGIAAMCMRRLIECRLLTDRFCNNELNVHVIHPKEAVEWREPFLNRSASHIFNNYDMTARYSIKKNPRYISSKLLHAQVIGVIANSFYLPDGLLIASDFQKKNNLFHFSPPEITGICDAFLSDKVKSSFDGYIDQDRKFVGGQHVLATRK